MNSSVYKILGAFPSSFAKLLYASVYTKKYMELIEKRESVNYREVKAIFVHIPKCAGMSINKAIFGSEGSDHTDITHYRLMFDKKDFDSYFKFTITRNPWERLYSAYTFLKNGGINGSDAEWSISNLSKYSSFEEFVLDGIENKEILRWRHFRPQMEFIEDKFTGKVPLDFVGKLENLESDFQIISKKIGLQDNILTHYNRTSREKTHLESVYTDEMVEIVSAVYSDDISYLNYKFGE